MPSVKKTNNKNVFDRPLTAKIEIENLEKLKN